MDPVYCALCIINMNYDERVPKPHYKITSSGQTIQPKTFDELIDAIASYGNRFEIWGVKFGGYAVTLVNGTALCQSHALIQMTEEIYRKSRNSK